MAYPDLARAVRSIDLALRQHLGIREFTEDEGCIFRISPSSSRADVCLSDGTQIYAGDPLLQLHLWNEHLPLMPQGPNAAWANRFRRMMHNSLVSVATLIEHSSDYEGIRACHGFSPFGSRIGALQMIRTARRFGFDVHEQGLDLRDRCHQVLDSMLLWGLAYSYNPAVLRGKTFIRRRYQLWISREKLLALYGSKAESGAARG
jgi:hypothetical protein